MSYTKRICYPNTSNDTHKQTDVVADNYLIKRIPRNHPVNAPVTSSLAQKIDNLKNEITELQTTLTDHIQKTHHQEVRLSHLETVMDNNYLPSVLPQESYYPSYSLPPTYTTRCSHPAPSAHHPTVKKQKKKDNLIRELLQTIHSLKNEQTKPRDVVTHREPIKINLVGNIPTKTTNQCNCHCLKENNQPYIEDYNVDLSYPPVEHSNMHLDNHCSMVAHSSAEQMTSQVENLVDLPLNTTLEDKPLID